MPVQPLICLKMTREHFDLAIGNQNTVVSDGGNDHEREERFAQAMNVVKKIDIFRGLPEDVTSKLVEAMVLVSFAPHRTPQKVYSLPRPV